MTDDTFMPTDDEELRHVAYWLGVEENNRGTVLLREIKREVVRMIRTLEAARAELRSETRWTKQYHDEAEQLREAVMFAADHVTQLAHENAMLRAEIEHLREAVAAQKR